MSRRRLGSVRLKRAPDYWEARLYLGRDPETGKELSMSRCVRGTYRDAERLLADLVRESNLRPITTSASVAELVAKRIDFAEARGLSPLTAQGYRSIHRAIADDPLGALAVAKVTGLDIDACYGRLLKKGLSAATVNRYHSLLRVSFHQAIKWGFIRHNPARLATPPKERENERPYVDDDVVASLIAVAAASRNPENAVAFRVLAASGGRRGEACAVRWRNVDFKRKRIKIRHSIAQTVDELIEKPTKTYQARTVTLDETSIAILRTHRFRQGECAHRRGADIAPDAFVFANLNPKRGGSPDGSVPIRPSQLTQAFRRARSQVPGASSLRLHDLRHWHCSGLVDAGTMSLPDIATRVGDRLETLVRVYVHGRGESDEAAATEIGNRLPRPAQD
jgi:integrase